MTDEQFTTGTIVEIINLYHYYYLTAKDIRRRGKNKVGVNPFKISAMNNIFFVFILFIFDLSCLQNAAQNCRKRANDRLTDLTEGNIAKTIIQSIHFHLKQMYKRKREKRRNTRWSWKE